MTEAQFSSQVAQVAVSQSCKKLLVLNKNHLIFDSHYCANSGDSVWVPHVSEILLPILLCQT
jgi:hypothetical protein